MLYSEPPQLGSTIESSATRLRESGALRIETWRQLDIPGRFLADSILKKGDTADFIVADVSTCRDLSSLCNGPAG